MVRRLRGMDARGATIVEFGIVGPVFLLLLLGVLELGLMVFTQSVLDNAARDAARLIRTGQVQNGGSQQTFQTLLCNEASALIGCGNILYQSQVFSDWSTAQQTTSQPPQRDKFGNPIMAGFTAGTGGQIVVVTVIYNYRFYTLWIGQLLGGASNSTFLESVVAFQNEPF